MSVRATELRKGSVVEKDGDLLVITDYHHSTPGNLRAFIQMKFKSLTSGQVSNVRASSNDQYELAYLERKSCEYLYREGNGDFIFMDAETFEQFPLPGELADEYMGYVRENSQVQVTFHENRPIGVDLPPTVVLEVTESEHATKGNTATNVKKEAIVETGMMVKVPLHVSVGDKIKIRTADGEFMGRDS